MPAHMNVEIKARCTSPDIIRRILLANGAQFYGRDHQIDTYFLVQKGRLKLREGEIEKYLIYYDRQDQEAPKISAVVLYALSGSDSPKDVLIAALGVAITVEKYREIYRIGSTKFHLDEVVDLGVFVEIEAKGENVSDTNLLTQQCLSYMALLGIEDSDLIDESYSDMMRRKK